MKKIILTIMTLSIMVSCANRNNTKNDYISPYDAIQMAATAAENNKKVEGVFSLTIQAVGNQGPNWYLNSELDYRDQRNLTIAIMPTVKAELVEKYGKDMESIFKGKTIHVEGEARRVKISIYNEGKKLKPYYYQTHVRVTNIHKIEFQ